MPAPLGGSLSQSSSSLLTNLDAPSTQSSSSSSVLSFSSLPPLPPLEPAVVLHSRVSVSQGSGDRVAFGAPSSPAPGPRPLGPPGTAENPLIPKRRRRTSPQEQKLLEDEFKRNPLPSQAERNRIAERVGMSGRVSLATTLDRRARRRAITLGVCTGRWCDSQLTRSCFC